MILWSCLCFLQIGFVLKKLFEDGVVKREDLWITSKLWFVFVLVVGLIEWEHTMDGWLQQLEMI